MILAHDITEVIPGKKKDVAFKKGTVIQRTDVERLLDLGKRHLYVFDGVIEGVHEEDAGNRIARAIMGKHMEATVPKEGKVSVKSTVDGLFKVNPETLYELNRIKDVLVGTLPNRYPVKAGDVIAAARIIPLYIDEKTLVRVEKGWKNKKMISVLPFKSLSAGIVVTGSEVYEGRVPDSSPIVEAKIKNYGSTVMGKTVVTDDIAMIRDAILDLFGRGADIVITTAGLSVDPDDITRDGIEATGAKTIFFGTPIAPGAMFLLAKLNGKYILGAPACVYFNRYTALDILLIRILAGEKISKSDVAMLAYGGLCTYCDVCHYPACHFGKGL
ncbi:MAG: molybdopterin biosynthesis protein [Deltaproteobacteria bacterium]|nr:molybdopterin biosynthesis protein [Deltaproteobacteria bacterium]